jgi:hypothetical protein
MAGPVGLKYAVGPSLRFSYDADALDYFARAEALGGSFDASAINAAYTAGYVKNAINTFVLRCKADGTWSKLTEIYLLAGVSFAGVTAKLKHIGSATLTNTGFLTGNYAAAGGSAGFARTVNTQLLNTGYTPTGLGLNPSLSMHITSYIRVSPVSGAIASTAVGNLNQVSLLFSQVRIPANTALDTFTQTNGFWVGSRTSNTLCRFFRNGTQTRETSVSATYTEPGTNLSLFRHTNSTAESALFTSSFFSVGSGLTNAEVTDLSSRVNTLMTALGANVY